MAAEQAAKLPSRMCLLRWFTKLRLSPTPRPCMFHMVCSSIETFRFNLPAAAFCCASSSSASKRSSFCIPDRRWSSSARKPCGGGSKQYFTSPGLTSTSNTFWLSPSATDRVNVPSWLSLRIAPSGNATGAVKQARRPLLATAFSDSLLVRTLRNTGSPVSCRASKRTKTCSSSSRSVAVSAGATTIPTSPIPTAKDGVPSEASRVLMSCKEKTTVPAGKSSGITSSGASAIPDGNACIGSMSERSTLSSRPRCPASGATRTTALSFPPSHLTSNTKAGVPL
mmetsp:Transcript_45549/g.105612  ORF Transcript_45549/g.105612 Transcript_45549/m.105612 type:complete len:282 (+) Transcript_45549:1089-1934(+)